MSIYNPPPSGGSSSSVSNEIVSGSGTAFTLAGTPLAGTAKIYARGQRLKLGTDYAIAGAAITTADTWGSGDIIADYQI